MHLVRGLAVVALALALALAAAGCGPAVEEPDDDWMVGTFFVGILDAESESFVRYVVAEDGSARQEGTVGCLGKEVSYEKALRWEIDGDSIRLEEIEGEAEVAQSWTLQKNHECVTKALYESGTVSLSAFELTKRAASPVSQDVVSEIYRGDFCLRGNFMEGDRDDDGNVEHGRLFCQLEPCGDPPPPCEEPPS